MKLNKIFSAFFIITASLLVSCSEYEDTVVPSPAVPANSPSARFAKANKTSYEFEPAPVMSFTLTVVRDNGNAALEVPVTVLTNTDNGFTVPATVSFSAGSDTAKLTIQMSASAPAGKPLSLAIKLDDQYANPYKNEYSSYYGQVSIIKWNNLGTVQFYDSFSFYKVAEVTLEQRDDIPNIYRINSPYQEGILTDAEWTGWIGGTTQSKILFTVNGDNITWDKFWYTNLIYEGTPGAEIKAYLPSAIGKDGDSQSVVVKDNAGNIQYFELYPSFYVDNVGGWGLNVVYVGFPGFDLAGALGLAVYQ